ncbi:MAG: hypothetical protein Q8P31_06325 [Bacillota bacterium]|nr:hypothetical protein [Bacillota bacterium]
MRHHREVFALAALSSVRTAGGVAVEVRPALRTRDIVRFHLPLAVTFLSYGIVFNIINASMSQTRDAAIALAAFAVGQSIVDLFAGPAGSGNQWLIARGRDRRSFVVGVRVMLEIALGVTTLLALVAFTPAGKWLYQGVFGAPARLSDEITTVIKFGLPLPIMWAWRNVSQSILMLRRQTHFMTVGVFLRLGTVWGLSLLLGGQSWVQGAGLGAVLWVAGMTVEAVFAFAVASRAFRGLPAEPASGVLPARSSVWRFLVPLMATGLLWAVARPFANAAMARTLDPERSIAAFQVAWFASFLLVALQVEFRQVMVVFWADRQSLAALRRFGLYLSGALSCLTLLLGITGAAAWFMRTVLGTPEELVSLANKVFIVAALGPVLWMLTELQVGQLLRNGMTTVIGMAKTVNLVVMGTLMFSLVALYPGLGALVGAIGHIGGAAAEAGVTYWFGRKVSAEPIGDD